MPNRKDRSARNRRAFIAGALVCMAALPAATGAETAAERKAKLTGLSPKGAPAADTGYTAGILAEGNKFIFVSGQGPRDRTADMETQMRQAFEKIGEILEAGGASIKDIAWLRGYFVNIARDLPVFRKVRKEFLAKPYPAATAVGISALAVPNLQFEIEAVAVL